MLQYVIFSLLLFMIACQPGKESPMTSDEDSSSIVLTQTQCMTCHKSQDESDALAPSLEEIHKFYNLHFNNPSKAEKHLINFVNNPTTHKAIMKDALLKYGLMPKLNYNPQELKAISSFIINTNFNQIEWNNAFAESSFTLNDDIDYLNIGQKIANETKMVLGKNLLNAIQEKGTEGALEFCNAQAIPLTDSVSNALNTKVKRVSDKPRNPHNQANEFELSYIEEIKKLKLSGGNITPQINEIDGKIIGFYPIETNDMCLKCHGKIGDQIEETTYKKIKSLYPNDKAHGYTNDQIRGIFVVEFIKK